MTKTFTSFIFFILILPPLSAQVPIKLSTGASIGGTGLAGIPVQLKFGEIASMDAGIYFRTVHVDEFEKKRFYGPAVDVGLNIYLLRKENQDKNKTTQQGLFIKGGYGLHIKEDEGLLRLQERSASLGWLLEIDRGKNPGRFFQLQSGPAVVQHTEAFLNTRYPPDNQLQSSERIMPMVYLRATWFFVIDASRIPKS